MTDTGGLALRWRDGEDGSLGPTPAAQGIMQHNMTHIYTGSETAKIF